MQCHKLEIIVPLLLLQNTTEGGRVGEGGGAFLENRSLT